MRFCFTVVLLYQGDLCKFFADFQVFEKSFEIFQKKSVQTNRSVCTLHVCLIYSIFRFSEKPVRFNTNTCYEVTFVNTSKSLKV